jgi:WD40 repeat protein
VPSHQTIKTHTKFVLDVRYAPSGDHFASVGSDGKIFLYDGKLGETLGEFSESHTGTAVSQTNVLSSMTKKFSRVPAGHSTR